MQDDKFFSDFKQCRDCGEWFPKTPDYFHKQPKCNDGLNSYCKECHRARNRKNIRKLRDNDPSYGTGWTKNNPEKVNEYQRRRYAENSDRERARIADFRTRNPEYQKQYDARRYGRKSAQYITYSREYRRSNPEKVKRQYQDYARLHPEKLRERNQRRRANKMSASGSHTAAEIRELLEWQDYKCLYCGADLHERYSEDHYYPLSSDIKDNSIHNIVLSCISCNSRKQDKLPFLFDSRCF